MKNTNTNRSVIFMSVRDLISLIESGKLDLDTEYQRDIIWTKEKKQLLIDSILINIDIPKFYFAYFKKEDQYECIDGKQRIKSILDFYHNSLSTKSGEKYQGLSKSNESVFLQYDLSMSIITNPSDENISELFLRVNFGEPLNGGELIHAMRGDMRDFIFKRIGEKGPFVGKVGIRGRRSKKAYRFSREITVAQMIISSLFFRKEKKFGRARYEDIRTFLEESNNKRFDSHTKKKVNNIYSILKKTEKVFGNNATSLSRKSVVVSAYLFCEDLIVNDRGKNIEKFPVFYIQLLEEMKRQGDLIKKLKAATNKIVLERFQKNLQQASVEGYSIERRHTFLKEAFAHYVKSGKIIGSSSKN